MSRLSVFPDAHDSGPPRPRSSPAHRIHTASAWARTATLEDFGNGSVGERLGASLAGTVQQLASQDWLVLGYLTALLVALLFGHGEHRDRCIGWVGADLGVYAAVLIAVRGRVLRWEGATSSLVYRLTLLASILASFFQLREILPTVSPWADDAVLFRFDTGVLGVEPSLWLDQFVSPATTEWFAFFYFLYFLLLASHILPMLFVERDVQRLGRFAVGLLLVFVTAHLLYIVVPGRGPYWYLRGAFLHPLSGGAFWRLVQQTVDAGGAQKDIFPSLHTAVPTYLTLFSYRQRSHRPFRFTWPVLLVVTTQIVVATLFLRWHYLADVLAGLALGIAGSALGQRLADWETAKRKRIGLQPAWMPLVYPGERTARR